MLFCDERTQLEAAATSQTTAPFQTIFQRAGINGEAKYSTCLHHFNRAMIASLRVAWTLTRQKRPFTEVETVKECMLAVTDEVVVDEKVKESVTSSIQKVPL